MARPITFYWPAADPAYICNNQTATAGVPIVFNGTFSQQAQAKGQTISPVNFGDVARCVSITSTGDLSGVQFTVNGTLNGAPLSETRAGPNNTTVQTTALFDWVTSISADADAVGINIGSGLVGRTHYFTYNYQSSYSMLSIQVNITNAATYSFGFTLDEVSGNLTPDQVLPTDILHNQTANGFGTCYFPIKYAFIQITAEANDTTVTSILQQQGIT